MCLLTFYPQGVMPDTQALWVGASVNDDGHGFAIVHNGEIIIGKSMDADEAIFEFEDLRHKYPAGPALFHSRIATAGLVNESNVHPFFVNGDARTVLAHNGVLPIRPAANDKRSDTRILADTLSKRFGSLRNHSTRAAIIKWMGAGNKLVILNVNPRLRASAFILNEDKGHWAEDGVWYSNYSYVPYTPKPTTEWWKSYAAKPSPVGWPTVIGFSRCFHCGVIQSETELQLGFCDTCSSCQDCAEHIAHCLCYVPAKAITKD